MSAGKREVFELGRGSDPKRQTYIKVCCLIYFYTFKAVKFRINVLGGSPVGKQSSLYNS